MVGFPSCHQDTSKCKWTAIARALARMLCCFNYSIQWRNGPKMIGRMCVHSQIQNCTGTVRTLLSQVMVCVCTCVCVYACVQVHIGTHCTTYLHQESVWAHQNWSVAAPTCRAVNGDHAGLGWEETSPLAAPYPTELQGGGTYKASHNKAAGITHEVYTTTERWQKRKTRRLPYTCCTCTCSRCRVVVLFFFSAIVP